MRILYIAHSFGAWGSDNRIWDRNIRDALVQMGHELIGPGFNSTQAHIECTHDRTGAARAKYGQILLDRVRSLLTTQPLDLMFTYYDNRNVLPEVLAEIRRLGVLTVNFFCNAAHEFEKVNVVAPHFDYCMVPERSALAKYATVGAHPIHIQMAANPRFYRPLDCPQVYDAVFVGTRYLNREEHLLILWRAGVDVHAFGPGWHLDPPGLHGTSPLVIPRRVYRVLRWHAGHVFRETKKAQLPRRRCHAPVSDDEMVTLFSQSRIVLGLSDVKDASGRILRHVRLRDFEVPMCGAFYLTGYQEELGEYYEIGREIECYDTLDELADKARYYLSHEQERERIRRAGLKRARSEHTWEHRFTKLFDAIGLVSR